VDGCVAERCSVRQNAPLESTQTINDRWKRSWTTLCASIERCGGMMRPTRVRRCVSSASRAEWYGAVMWSAEC